MILKSLPEYHPFIYQCITLFKIFEVNSSTEYFFYDMALSLLFPCDCYIILLACPCLAPPVIIAAFTTYKFSSVKWTLPPSPPPLLIFFSCCSYLQPRFTHYNHQQYQDSPIILSLSYSFFLLPGFSLSSFPPSSSVFPRKERGHTSSVHHHQKVGLSALPKVYQGSGGRWGGKCSAIIIH